MITDLGRYWRTVRSTEKNLPEGDFQYVISIENEDQGPNCSPGRVVEVPREQAAQRIVEKTHRLATEEEIETFRNGQRAEAERIAKVEFDKRQPIAITVLGDGTARVSKGTLPKA